MFVAANGAISFVEKTYPKYHLRSDNKRKHEQDNVLADSKSISTVPPLRKRRINSSKNNANSSDFEMIDSASCASGFIREVHDVLLKLWFLKWQVLVTFAPYLLVFVAFGSFVIWNGSIVLGAKEAHVVSLHFAQMMYFALVSTGALAPLHFCFDRVSTLCVSFWKNKLTSSFVVLLVLSMGFIVVRSFSIAHPYLLADNRHYTFYIWRKVIHAHWMVKYLLVPLYVYSWISIVVALGKTQKKIWVVSYIFATALVLIPAPLIEFRYYTAPFFLLYLHSNIDDHFKLLLVGTLYVFVDIFTMVMFLFRPFKWDHEPGTQRFIW